MSESTLVCSASEPILDPKDSQDLAAEGTLWAVPGQRARLIHKRRLYRSSEEEYAHLPLPTPPPPTDYQTPSSVVTSPSASSDDSTESFSKIPEFLYSRESLLYAGFIDEAADQIWERWASWPAGDDGREIDGGPVTFVSMATGHIRSAQKDAYDSDDSKWFEVLNAYGIAEPMQVAIMAPEYRSIRLTQSCQDWVLDTIRARFEGLGAIQATSRERGWAAAHDVQRQAAGISSEPASSPHVRANAPGFTTLWKGVFQARIDRYLGANNTITDFSPLMSLSSDFSSRVSGLCFALDYEVAEHYACYAKKRALGEPCVILKLLVPTSALENLISPEKLCLFYPSKAFQETVWTCRRGTRLRQELRQASQATLIIGHICRRPNQVVINMDSYRDIDQTALLRNSSGNAAIQYVFVGDQGDEFLEDNRARCTAHRVSWTHAGYVAKTLALTES